MKRVKAACICQTLHFFAQDGVGHEYAARVVAEEVAAYKAKLERDHMRFRITSEEAQPDGSVILKVKKQYNNADVGEYLD